MTLVLGFNVDIANQFFGSIWKTRKISLIVFGSLCLVQVHAELDQLRKGLFETLQFELLTISQVLLRQRTLKWHLLLCDFISIDYCVLTIAPIEEAIMYNWNEYIFGLWSFWNRPAKYAWRMLWVPATGFPKTSTIRFTDVDCLPTVSTCDVSLMFPRKMAVRTISELLYQGILRVWNYLSSSVLIIIVVFHIYLTFITTEPEPNHW